MSGRRNPTPRLSDLPPLAEEQPKQRKHSGILAAQMGIKGQNASNESSTKSADVIVTKGVERRNIRLDAIDENPFAPREIYTPEMLLARATSIRAHGQNDAIHVIPHPDDPERYMIADGWTRVQACLLHDVCETLRADIHLTLSPKEAAWFGYEQNECREGHCDLDRSMFFQKQLADGVLAKDVMERAGIKKSMWAYYQSFAKLDSDVLDVIRQSDNPALFAANIASYLFRLQSDVGVGEAVSFANKFKTGSFTHVQFIERVTKRLEGENEKRGGTARNTGKTLRYNNGIFRTKGNKVVLNLALPSEVMDDFTIDMEKLLSKYTDEEVNPAPDGDLSDEK